jgi:hypothetical protein
MKTTTHKLSNGQKIVYTAEQKSIDFACLVLKGFTKKQAEDLIKARYK